MLLKSGQQTWEFNVVKADEILLYHIFIQPTLLSSWFPPSPLAASCLAFFTENKDSPPKPTE